MDDEDKKKACLTLTLVITFVSCMLLGYSFDTVEPQHWAIKCSTISKLCDNDKVYGGGRYFTGVTGYFIEFPRHQLTLYEDSLASRTYDGFSINLELSVQYQLEKSQLGLMYQKTALAYRDTYNRIAKDIIMQSAGNYNASMYWTDRKAISKDMLTEMDIEFKKISAHVLSLQLIKIDLPDSFESIIVDTQVEVQNKKMRTFERTSILIRKSTEVLVSDTNRQIIEINSDATAQGIKLKADAKATGLDDTIGAEKDVAQNITTKLTISGADLQKYMVYTAAMSNSTVHGKLVVGLDNVLVKSDL